VCAHADKARWASDLELDELPQWKAVQLAETGEMWCGRIDDGRPQTSGNIR